MFAGAVFLSHSPLITVLRGEGKGAEYEELLSRRGRHLDGGTAASPMPDGGLPFTPT